MLLVLQVVLSWTMGSWNMAPEAAHTQFECSPGTQRTVRITGVRVLGKRQAAAQDSMAAAVQRGCAECMRITSELTVWACIMATERHEFRRWWPLIRAQAEERLLLSVAYPDSVQWRLPGTRAQAVVSRGELVYGVQLANPAGWGCVAWVAPR